MDKLHIYVVVLILASFTVIAAGEGQLPDFGVSDEFDMTNVLALWHMNETGGAVRDYGTDTYNLTNISGTPTYNVDGVFDTGIYLEAAPDSGFNRTTDGEFINDWPISVSIWAKKSNTPDADDVLFSLTNSTDEDTWLILQQISGTNDIKINVNDGGGAQEITASNVFNDTEWHHITVIISNDNSRSIYLDGVLIVTDTTGVNYPGFDQITVGSYITSSQGFNGTMDEVAVFSEALNPSDVQALYQRAPVDVVPFQTEHRTHYPYVSRGTDYVIEDGIFNTQVAPSVSTFGISNGNFIPIVTDLEGRGHNQLIHFDGDTLIVREDETLDVIDSITTIYSATDNKQIYTMNLTQGNEVDDIIVISDDEDNVSVFTYNGSDVVLAENFDLFWTGAGDARKQFACREDGLCMAVAGHTDGATTQDLDFKVFNASQFISNLVIATSGANEMWCPPRIRSVDVVDTDGDNIQEFVFTEFLVSTSGGDTASVYIVEVNSSGGASVLASKAVNDGGAFGSDCATVGDYVTAPIAHDIKDSWAGEEIIVGANEDTDNYQLHIFRNDLGVVAEENFPDNPLVDADGVIISNVFIADVFDYRSDVEACVLGWDTTDNEIEMLCANPDAGILEGDDDAFFIFVNDDANYTFPETGKNSYVMTVHGTNMVEDTNPGFTRDLDEILTTHGVFYLAESGTYDSKIGFDDMGVIYNMPVTNASWMCVDMFDQGSCDLFGISPNNLVYIDDVFVNQPPNQADAIVNPCTDLGPWRENTTVNVVVTVSDPEGDNVRAKALLYNGTEFEQDSGYSDYTSSGSSFSFSFTAWNITNNAQLVVIAEDTQSGNDLRAIKTFSVADDGTEFGECTESFEGITPTTSAEAQALATFEDRTETDVTNNSFVNMLEPLREETGFGYAAMWLILTVALGFSMVWIGHKDNNTSLGMYAGVAVTVGMIIIGSVFQLISFGILVTLVILGVGILAWRFRSMFAGT